ncbi:phage tail protein [Chelatococcus asaccharovorans]|uniref:Phage protein U n=1 Tax=Chelatococcus asaccharovorans TaxID=28210 RepID=A0A2V3UC18_9HYPH|nr:phage tail protein [Chelatococcus asaccharovorans]MBS7703333.1 phage tail protein [Chelatococcus asaccharovorans]PXW61668.1 hypothetical protein C7450_103185 [Chelatococcus asaccharovorans]
MSTILMGLGPHRFGLAAANYQDLKNRITARWPANKVIGAQPIYQFLGPDDHELSLQGLIFPEWMSGYDELSALRGSAAAGSLYSFASNLGDVFGNWIILGVESSEARFNRGGLPRRVEFSLLLVKGSSRYGTA